MAVSEATLAPAIVAFLRKDLRLGTMTIEPDTSLVTSGVIDSVGLVRVATFLEEQTGITIPDRDINAEHFDTLRTILDYVMRRARG